MGLTKPIGTIGLLSLLRFGLSASLFVFPSQAKADSLTLYFMRTPLGLNWKTPTALARSTVISEIASLFSKNTHSIGHAYVRLECSNLTPVYLGMTGASGNETRDLLFRKHIGLGILFHRFIGRLQEGNEVISDIDRVSKTKALSYVNYLISPSTCQRMHRYQEEFKKNGRSIPYGLPNRPLYREGAGCSAFAASFLEVGGLVEETHVNEWKREIRVPHDTVGGSLTQLSVPFFSLLKPFKKIAWAQEHEAHFKLSFWDPDKMFWWAKKRAERGSLGSTIDRSNIPTPQGTIFFDE